MTSILFEIDFSPQSHRGHRGIIFLFGGPKVPSLFRKRYPPNGKPSLLLKQRSYALVESFRAFCDSIFEGLPAGSCVSVVNLTSRNP
jgi:hypothetical protein